MSRSPTRRSTLLSAYEDFTRRETVCLKDEDFELLAKVQDKKVKVIAELQSLEDSPDEAEKHDFNRRLEVLVELEKANEATLTQKMANNRQELRNLTKRSASATKLRRAYAPSGEKKSGQSSLEGRA